MAEQGLKAFNGIKKCINENTNFVLQGGAGSGKTETLKRTLEYIVRSNPDRKIVCITHTNLAADQIKSRVGEGHTISTIHSFLNSIIKDYKKNLHRIMIELFKLDLMTREEIQNGEDEKEYKKSEHAKYRKTYNRYAGRLFIVKKEKAAKVEGKRIYDGDLEKLNAILNDKIVALNTLMAEEISAKDHNIIEYNDTRFNNYHDLTYGHDGLIDLSALLFEKFPLIGKIVQDKFDCVFIDEYQDTNAKTISIFLEKIPQKEKMLVGLFGDSMQSIYGDGIGDVDAFIEAGVLKKIDKKDNFRCSEQVTGFVNQFRYDGLKQKVAFKTKENGEQETLADRQGTVELYYSYYGNKPSSRDRAARDHYIEKLDKLVEAALNGQSNFKQLKLTNKSIANDVGFSRLYKIFNDRYVETQDQIEKALNRLQFSDLFELCQAYRPTEGNPDYNLVLKMLRRQGFVLRKLSDKQDIKDKIETIINSELGAFETLNLAIELQLISKSENHELYVQRGQDLLKGLRSEDRFKEFKVVYFDDGHTFIKFKKQIALRGDTEFSELDEDDFNELKRDIEQETFYSELFSPELKYREFLLYFKYLDEQTDYITMHKTKGGEIENVLVVLDEYFWTQEYNFKTAFMTSGDVDKIKINQRLIYVACSRAKSNLKCVRLVSDEEETAAFSEYFDNVHEVELL